MMSILVTGGAGYVGSHICKALANAGRRPVVLDNLSMGHRWAVKWGPLVEGDVGDRRLVRHTLERYDIDTVIHLAAHAAVGESMENPHKYLYGNVASSLELLEAMREAGVRRIVFSSSCAVYGAPCKTPIPEDSLQVPVNPYGESKLFVERAVQWYEHIHGFAWVVLRYFNAAGADPEGEVGEMHDPETHVIPLVIQAALGQRPAAVVMGTDYDTPDGTCIRDFTHVSDLADAHVNAVDHLLGGGESVALNLGTGCAHSVREVIAAVERVGGRPVSVREFGRRPGDPAVLAADTTRAQAVLGWKPRYRKLDDVISTAWQWHSSGGAGQAEGRCLS
jgi:UDP-arabinose 4-epimerase